LAPCERKPLEESVVLFLVLLFYSIKITFSFSFQFFPNRMSCNSVPGETVDCFNLVINLVKNQGIPVVCTEGARTFMSQSCKFVSGRKHELEMKYLFMWQQTSSLYNRAKRKLSKTLTITAEPYKRASFKNRRMPLKRNKHTVFFSKRRKNSSLCV